MAGLQRSRSRRKAWVKGMGSAEHGGSAAPPVEGPLFSHNDVAMIHVHQHVGDPALSVVSG